MTPPRNLVLLCTYNERGTLPEMVALIHKSVPAADILIVDDNSPDGTGDWVREIQQTDSQVHLLSRSGKLGLGTAILAGLRWAIEQNYVLLVNMDADLSHDPSDIPRLMGMVEGNDDVDVAVGSRYAPGGRTVGWPLHRRVISRLLNGFARLALKLPVRDCSGSFRCYRVELLRQAKLEELQSIGYDFLEELLVTLHRRGARIREVPICFTERRIGRSKLTMAEGYRALRTILRLRLRTVG